MLAHAPLYLLTGGRRKPASSASVLPARHLGGVLKPIRAAPAVQVTEQSPSSCCTCTSRGPWPGLHVAYSQPASVHHLPFVLLASVPSLHHLPCPKAKVTCFQSFALVLIVFLLPATHFSISLFPLHNKPPQNNHEFCLERAQLDTVPLWQSLMCPWGMWPSARPVWPRGTSAGVAVPALCGVSGTSRTAVSMRGGALRRRCGWTARQRPHRSGLDETSGRPLGAHTGAKKTPPPTAKCSSTLIIRKLNPGINFGGIFTRKKRKCDRYEKTAL